jgi:hypothetical protein
MTLRAVVMRSVVGSALLGSALWMVPAPAVAAGTPVTGAVSTSTNESATVGNGACLHGTAVNCNIYASADDVWLSGLPTTVGDGTYFFAVLSPGAQPDPQDGSDGNLSSPQDPFTDRMFSITGGALTNLGAHEFQNGELQLAPFDPTPNPGGVYILAVCQLDPGDSTSAVDASSCKYDAFKVRTSDQAAADPLTITKDAAGSFDTTWTWGITKSVDKTRVEQIGGSTVFTYSVGITHDGGTDSNVRVTGTIDVFNPNLDPVAGAVVTDQLSDGTVCTVTGGDGVTVDSGDNYFPYSCSLTDVPSGELDNNASVAWDGQSLTDDGDLAGGSADFTFSSIAFDQTRYDDCVTVGDVFGLHGTTGTASSLDGVCASDPSPTTQTYSRTVTIPAHDCLSYDNTATFTTNSSGTTGSAGKTVTVCGPARTGALTMGYWQNKNGQSIVSGGATTTSGTIKVCNSGTWLRQFAPFQDLSGTASCAQVATYVSSTIKAATCTSTMKTCNAMLKAQMLATSLDVYFSDAGLGGNKIGAPAPVGGVSIDLTKICKMIDGSGGTATCAGAFEDTSPAFGGAHALTVLQMLGYAAAMSNPGGSNWYGQVKATQVLAKDAFDAINNQVAFSA